MWRIALVSSVALASAGLADEAPPGAQSCTGCHGEGGILLSALTEEEIAAAMTAFRSGAREATLMGRIAAGFTQPEIDAIARWLAREE